MYDYDFFSFDSKADFLRRSEEFWNPDKTRFWQDAGVDLVIDRREGYVFWDMAGRRLIDLHLNGGTYNLGHRNPELIAVLEQAMGRFDIGNHHFPALARTALAEALVATCPPSLQRVIYASGGGEATVEIVAGWAVADEREDMPLAAPPEQLEAARSAAFRLFDGFVRSADLLTHHLPSSA